MNNSPLKLPVQRVLISLSLIGSLLVLGVAGRCHDGEREALTKFRHGLNDPLNRLSSWANLPDCCRWRGISCDKKTGYVTKLDLKNPYPRSLIPSREISKYGYWNLSGQLDQNLQELKHLRYLDLSFNSFHGKSMPAFFGSLSELRYLNLSNAGFQGVIPPQLGNLSKHEYLDLSSSYSTASLTINNHQWLGNMHNLRYLDMNHVNLSPADEYWLHMINKLPLLEEFRCKACSLSTFPPTLPSVNFTSLRVLDLSNNNFQRIIPNWMGNLSNLVSLDLSDNTFNTTFPYWLPEKLYSLKELKIAAAYLGGSLGNVLDLVSWKKMVRIDLSGNRLYGEIPMSLGNITTLVELDLSENQINGSIPNFVKDCNFLHELFFINPVQCRKL